MIIFPAVDIKDGKCVRLKQGLADQVTVFSDNPVDMAVKWEKAGGKWLHVIDLDGAFSGKPKNEALIREICSTLSIPVQLGGGVRSIEIARAYLDAGVERLIIGTMALEDPEGFTAMCKTFPGKIGVSLDAVDGQLKTKGWVEDAGETVLEVAPRLADQGAAFIIYTDIARDGMQSGVNADALRRLCQATSLPVIAAGGVATLDDVKALYPLWTETKDQPGGLEGAITGRAIYAGTLDLAESMAWIESQ